MNVCISSVCHGDAGEEKEGRPPVCRHGQGSVSGVRRAVLVPNMALSVLGRQGTKE